jgi:hypothetical protein
LSTDAVWFLGSNVIIMSLDDYRRKIASFIFPSEATISFFFSRNDEKIDLNV